MQLPDELKGDLVLLQWHYLSGNSCSHPGYDTYMFPAEWGSMGYAGLSECESIPEDGDGVPEQFWNCIEVSVLGNDSSVPVPVPTDPTTTAPAATPVPVTGKPTSAAPVAGTEAPTTTQPMSSAPVIAPETPPGPSGTTLVVSTESRCGVSELDARGNCGAACTTQAECAAGEWCWTVQANYCGTRPGFALCNDLSLVNNNPRCGATELDARELCGLPCTDNSMCSAGEYCFPTHMNTCDCVQHGQKSSSHGFLRGFP